MCTHGVRLLTCHLGVRVDLAQAHTWHSLPPGPLLVRVMFLSHPGLTVNVGDPHLALLVEPPVEGHGALGQLLVPGGGQEALQVGYRVGPQAHLQHHAFL